MFNGWSEGRARRWGTKRPQDRGLRDDGSEGRRAKQGTSVVTILTSAERSEVNSQLAVMRQIPNSAVVLVAPVAGVTGKIIDPGDTIGALPEAKPVTTDINGIGNAATLAKVPPGETHAFAPMNVVKDNERA